MPKRSVNYAFYCCREHRTRLKTKKKKNDGFLFSCGNTMREEFLYFYKIDVRERVLGEFNRLIKTRFKPEAVETLSSEMIENAVDATLQGYKVTNVDLAIAMNQSDVLCVKCGECCRRVDPIMVERDDVMLIASSLRCNYQSVVEKYTKPLDDDRLSLRTPCPFLQDNRCSIHPARPKVCRFWPFTLEGEHITLGIQPYCKFTLNFFTEKTCGALITALIAREAPSLTEAIRNHAENLRRSAPSEQTQQIQYFKKWINNKEKPGGAFESFSQYAANLLATEDFLLPNETVRYRSETQVKYDDEFYTLYVTNLRLIAHTRSGLMLYTKDKLVAERFKDIQNISYKETGILSKKGILTATTQDTKVVFEGNPKEIKTIWQKTQLQIGSPEIESKVKVK